MSETPDSESVDSTGATESLATMAIVSNYKVLGQFTDTQGAGVLGQNDSQSGTPLGVQGAVPNSADGFGLATPDDARVEGDIDSSTEYRLTVGGAPNLRLGPEGTDSNGDPAGGNVVAGFKNNTANNAIGATISGGGGDGGLNDDPNRVTDNFGTVGGGRSNIAGDAQSGVDSAVHATVGGGEFNEASGKNTTVGGGTGNKATAYAATVAGGKLNEATDRWATIAGGDQNQASQDDATVGGGEFNIADGSDSTIAGGSSNTAIGTTSAIGGGGNNRTGVSGQPTGNWATIPGGRQNLAAQNYTFAAGRQAKAEHEGAFVWADSTSGSVTSTTSDSFLVQAGGGAGIGTNSPSTQLDVDGAVTASDGYRGNVGGAAFLTTNQTVSGGTTATVAFDSTEADQRGEFNTSTGQFVCKYAGDYAVDVGVNMSAGTNPMSGGDEIHVNIAVEGISEAEKVYIAPQAVEDPTITVSRTLFGLSANDSITAELNNTTSGTLEIYGGSIRWTWMTVRQVG